MGKNVSVIGAGFSGLTAACYLAKYGYAVTVYEKNSMPGGRAGQIKEDGFIFDLGPTWYWMPDIFESFFEDFQKKVSDYYTLVRLDPSYRVFYEKDDYIDIRSSHDYLRNLFEELEPGSSKNLDKFLDDAEKKYKIGVQIAAQKPGYSLFEYINKEIIFGALRLDVLKSVSSYIRKLFKNERLIKFLEFPVVFLGSSPQRIPALYTLMNYGDLVQGTWYPEGGFYSVINGFYKLAKELGVKFEFNSEIKKINVTGSKVNSIDVNNANISTDFVLASADYNHVETKLLDKSYRNYTEKYWDKREMAPSALLYYIGLNCKLNNLLHHNIFFDEDFHAHADEIYEKPGWPEKPCLYISCSSKTDKTIAPERAENLIVLIPVASGLEDSKEIQERYYNYVIDKLEKVTDQKIRENVIYKKMFSHTDFITLFNAYKGNAYGLSNILRQTGIFKPAIRNKKVKNLFYCGQLTVPGPGVPPSILSGKIVAKEIKKQL